MRSALWKALRDSASGARGVGGGHCAWCCVHLGSACFASLACTWWHTTQHAGKSVCKPVWRPHCTDIMLPCIDHGPAKLMVGACCGRTDYVPSPRGGPVFLFFFLNLSRSGGGSLQKCLQNPHFESCSHYFFLGLNAKANSSVRSRRGTTGSALLPALSAAHPPRLLAFVGISVRLQLQWQASSLCLLGSGALALISQSVGSHIPANSQQFFYLSNPLIASLLTLYMYLLFLWLSFLTSF